MILGNTFKLYLESPRYYVIVTHAIKLGIYMHKCIVGTHIEG